MAGGPVRVEADRLLAAAGTTLLCAAPLEIAVDSAFCWATGEPAWRYLVAPVHHGYTSVVGILIWPMYGAFVELIHAAIRVNPRLAGLDRPGARAVLVAVDAMALEILANLYSLFAFGRFYFYYLPDDLFHLTTFRIFLPYVAAGYVGVVVLERVQGLRARAWVGFGAWASGAALVLALSRATLGG